MGDEYMEVNSKEYRRKPPSQVYSLASLDDDFLQHVMPHLKGKDVQDVAIKSQRTGGTDVIDARGIFLRKEVSQKLCNLRQSELEGQLGISSAYKVDQILKRAEQRTQEMANDATKREKLKGKVDYKIFLGEFLHFIKLPITFLLCRSDKRVQTEHRAGDKGFSNDPSLCLRGGVHLLPPNLCHARAHPARAGHVRLHQHRDEPVRDGSRADHLDRTGALLLPPHLQPEEALGVVALHILHVGPILLLILLSILLFILLYSLVNPTTHRNSIYWKLRQMTDAQCT